MARETSPTGRYVGTDLLPRSLEYFTCGDLEASREFLYNYNMFFNPRRPGSQDMDLVVRGVTLPGSYFGYIRYGTEGEAGLRPDHQPPDETWIVFPLNGAAEIVTGGRTFISDPGRLGVYPGGYTVRATQGAERLTFTMKKATLMHQLMGLLGDVPTRALDFHAELDPNTATARRLRRRVDLMMADLQDIADTGVKPATMAMYEQMIVTELLLSQPSNYTAALEALESRIAPGDVKRAIDFIEGNLHLPLTLPDIALAAGVPGRTLLEHFQHHRGVSPMRYVRDARLARVRAALLQDGRDGSVTEIALTWGFTHLGRFAAEYRRLFGESPSATSGRHKP